MKRYINIYIALLKINLASLIIYRANFINSLLSSVSWGIFSILSILLLTSKTTQVYSWSQGEIILLTAMYSIFIGIFHTIFTRNIEKIPELVDRGYFDLILTKPVDSQFLSSVRYFNYTSLSRIVVGIIALVLILIKYNISFSIANLPIYIVLSIFGLGILYNIWFIITTLSFWFTQLNNIHQLMFSIANIGRFPPEAFSQIMGYTFLFILPITLIVISPVKALTNNLNLYDILAPLLFFVGLSFIARKFWLYGLKHYTSAGG
ncbi:ABC-2 family transporter protein [Candidatus Gottesmanbacteria bacterium]|nr:ABC-2 family transporter protein [Candidatus Gottesmanbacteria bacterium]